MRRITPSLSRHYWTYQISILFFCVLFQHFAPVIGLDQARLFNQIRASFINKILTTSVSFEMYKKKIPWLKIYWRHLSVPVTDNSCYFQIVNGQKSRQNVIAKRKNIMYFRMMLFPYETILKPQLITTITSQIIRYDQLIYSQFPIKFL